MFRVSGVLQPDTLRRQVDHVLASSAFRNSSALRRLLEYLSHRTLSGDSNDIKEYRIGVEALGRPASYDPRSDPSVRVQVGRLRTRLSEYYQEEGAEDPIIISVPKGGFTVVFDERPARWPIVDKEQEKDLENLTSSSLESAPPTSKPKTRYGKSVMLGLLVATILMSALFMIFRPPVMEPAGQDSVIADFWAPYLGSSRPMLISLGVPLWLRTSYDSNSPDRITADFRDTFINEWPTRAGSAQEQREEWWKRKLQTENLEPRFEYLAVGEALAAATLSRTLGKYGDPQLARSNLLSWDSIRASNAILIGAPKFTPHLRNTDFVQNFRIGSSQVHNLKPKPGEASAYPAEFPVTNRRGAALIGRYRNPGGGWLTLIGSPNSMCTWAAVEYITRADYLTKLVTDLRKHSGGKMPESFEVVIEATFDQLSPVEIHHEAIREIP